MTITLYTHRWLLRLLPSCSWRRAEGRSPPRGRGDALGVGELAENGGYKLLSPITTTCLLGVRFSTAAAGKPITSHFCPPLPLLKTGKHPKAPQNLDFLQP